MLARARSNLYKNPFPREHLPPLEPTFDPQPPAMPSTLEPTPEVVRKYRTDIQSLLQTDGKLKIAMVALLLAEINNWATQIPVLLESVACINHVFDIRGDLFTAPRFTTNVFNVPFSDLPPAFHDFMNFIHKLIEAQKVVKDKTPVKVLSNPFYCADVLDCPFLLDNQAYPGDQVESLCRGRRRRRDYHISSVCSNSSRHYSVANTFC
jgi:hypothetical protein